ncbi:uncharacterized protein LOC143596294 [Bidens hawaiensis]|uniref:uncharacterized protein LOC143596294 n=1 Tax=Bidens hawaiensis TaxID=980011 RepID=UPI004048EE64
MPKYAKFLKDLLKRKDRLAEVSSIPLMGDCSAVVLNRVPEKLSDPCVFTIPVFFSSDSMSHALADLGTSINLMPYSLYEKLELGELTPTRMSLPLADQAGKKVPIILGRPFLRTAKVLIDLYDGKITLRVGDENVTYDVARLMKHPSDQDDFSGPCHSVYFINSFIADYDDLDENELGENDLVCDELAEISGLPEMIEVNEISCKSEAGSEEKPAPLELKVLLSYLEYAYLDEGSNLPVIVSSKVTEEQKLKLIDVLKLHKVAIAWRFSDIQVYGNSFDKCLANLEKMLKRCIETKLMLNWEKCHFMVTEGIVVGHKISRDGIEVDRAKVDTISRLPPPKNVKAIKSFLGHAGFYRRFIKDFSKIFRPMTRLLKKDVLFVFYDECVKAFTYLKGKLFDIEIKDKKGAENIAADHLSRIEDPGREELREEEIGDTFPDESIDFVAAKKQGMPWFTDFANYLVNGLILEGMTTQLKRKFFRDVNRGHHGAHATAQKVLDSGLYWATIVKDAEEFVKLCDACQRTGNLKSKWSGPYLVKEVFPYGVVELENPDNRMSWKVNVYRLKHYLGGPEESFEMEETPLDPAH